MQIGGEGGGGGEWEGVGRGEMGDGGPVNAGEYKCEAMGMYTGGC